MMKELLTFQIGDEDNKQVKKKRKKRGMAGNRDGAISPTECTHFLKQRKR